MYLAIWINILEQVFIAQYFVHFLGLVKNIITRL